LEEETFLKVLKELKNNNFNQEKRLITLNGNSEPMSDIELLQKRTNQIKKILPFVKIGINTNGDFFNKNNLENLNLDKISIMDYDLKGKDFWVEKIKKTGAIIKEHDKESKIIKFLHKKINEIVIFYNWPKNKEIEDMAGILKENVYYLDGEKNKKIKWKNKKKKRDFKCFEPLNYLSIDYNGNILLCCHIRSENENHKDYIYGNVNDNSLREIYYSKKFKDIRDKFNRDVDFYPSICQNCQKKRENNIEIKKLNKSKK
jgi:radical SAM protein with 4Fe4S-binding SPASM domain